MLALSRVYLAFDGDPQPTASDLAETVRLSAENALASLHQGRNAVLYRAANQDTDTPAGPWLYAKPSCRAYWVADYRVV